MKKVLLPINSKGIPINIAVDNGDIVVKLSEEHIIRLLNQYTDEERMDMFGNFCRSCGSKFIPCHCWNDE